jgi:hypothetical protein
MSAWGRDREFERVEKRSPTGPNRLVEVYDRSTSYS